jgi:hypothetical protein
LTKEVLVDEKKPEFICITEFEHCTSFALVADGKYAFAQFSNNDVPDPVDGVWGVRQGAKAKHVSVRKANWDETVRVDGAKFMPGLMEQLRALLAAPAKAA